MTTFEMTNSLREHRDRLRELGFSLKNLGDGFWNVMCEDEQTNDLEEVLTQFEQTTSSSDKPFSWRLV